MLLRRFSRQTFRVRRLPTPRGAPEQGAHPVDGTAPAGQLDFDAAADMAFSPDKFRALLERAYIQLSLPLVRVVRHLHRIFTWADRPRSTLFCVLYFSAWAASRLEGTFLLLLLALILSQSLRAALFPPLPDSASAPGSASSSHPPSTSTAGTAANLMGFAAERDAARLVDAIGTMAATMVGFGPEDSSSASAAPTSPDLSMPSTPLFSAAPPAAGCDELAIPQTDEPTADSCLEDRLEELAGAGTEDVSRDDAALSPSPPTAATRQETTDSAGDATASANTNADANVDANPDVTANDNLHKSIWRAAAPYLFVLVTLVDTVERFGNALSPTPPFPEWEPRLRLAGVVGGFVLLLWSGLVSPSLVYHGATFMVGIAMFGTPVLHFFFPTTTEVVADVVDEVVDPPPGWRYGIQLRHTLLKGMPTNAQLAATLLRMAEQADKPVPPSPADPLAQAGRASKASGGQAETQNQGPIQGQGSGQNPGNAMPTPHRTPSSDLDQANVTRAAGASARSENKPTGYKRAMFKSFVKTSAQLGTETFLGAGKVKASLLGSVPSRYSLAAPASAARAASAYGAPTAQRPNTQRVEGPAIFRARYANRPGLLHILPYRDGVRAPHLRWLPESRMAGAMGHVATFTGLDWSWANGQSSLAPGKPSSARATPAPVSAAPAPVPAQPETEASVPGQGEVYIADAEGKLKLVEVDLAMASLTGVRKRGGVGFSSRVMLSWMLDIEAVDVLELTTPTATFRFSDVMARDALVTRILALAPHRWELA